MDIKSKYEWLKSKAHNLIDVSRITLDDGTILECVSPPEGLYKAMFTRDFAYKVITCPEMYRSEKTQKTLELILENISDDMVVPEFIHMDGRVEYWTFGAGPLTDNAQSLVQACIAYCNEIGDKTFIIDNIELLYGCLNAIPVAQGSNLVWIDPYIPHSGYGYTDQVQKTGEELFTSVLLYQTYTQLAQFLAGEVRFEKIKEQCKNRSNKIKGGLERLFDPSSGFYMAASIDCYQPDVWGTALAVYTGAAGEREKLASETLIANYEKCVWKGQVRHLPTPYIWERLLNKSREYRRDFVTGEKYIAGRSAERILKESAPNRYHNGAYWATPSGWFAASISKTDPVLGAKMLLELVDFFIEDGIYECVYADGYRKEKDYTISAVLPLLGFKNLFSN